jgi:hypothetical protein
MLNEKNFGSEEAKTRQKEGRLPKQISVCSGRRPLLIYWNYLLILQQFV